MKTHRHTLYLLVRRRRDPNQPGQGLVEYALILALVALLVVVALKQVQPAISTSLNRTGNALALSGGSGGSASTGFTVSASPTSIPAGGFSAVNVTLTNNTGSPVTLGSSPGSFGNFNVVDSACHNQTLPAGGSCALTIQYSGGSSAGTYTIPVDSPVSTSASITLQLT